MVASDNKDRNTEAVDDWLSTTALEKFKVCIRIHDVHYMVSVADLTAFASFLTKSVTLTSSRNSMSVYRGGFIRPRLDAEFGSYNDIHVTYLEYYLHQI